MGFSVLPPFLSTEIQNKDFTYMSSNEFKLHLSNCIDKWSNYLKDINKINPLVFSGWSDWDKNGVEIKIK